ncbi:MAG: MFS transporter, partial [Myxococcota bacterium]
ALWWFMLSGLGLFFPFYALYLTENVGLSGTQVGLVLAALPLMGLFAQPFWGGLADRTGARARVLAGVALGAGAGYALLAFTTGFVGYLAATAGLALFSTALLPMAVSTSLASLDERSERAFGRVRVMGTLGYAASVGGLPFLLAWLPPFGPAQSGASTPGLAWIFPLAALSLWITTAVALKLRVHGQATVRAEPGEWRALIRNPAFIRVLAFTLLAYFCMQGATVLFPILVRAHGGGLEAVSRMWLIMLALEVPLVYWVGASMERIGPRGVIAIGLGAAAVRWGISGFVSDLGWVYAAQILHGVTVWGILLGVPLYANRVMPGALRSTGQGLLAMVGVSLGSVLSNFTGGWLVEHVGPKAPAQYASLACLALLVLLPALLRRSDIKAA